ncbi:MAG: hypothetical protein RL885_01610 [Planctomycetota bacterium]
MEGPGLLGVAAGTAAVVKTKSPMAQSPQNQEDLNRAPGLTQEIATKILVEQDRDAVYRILGHYDRLDPIERSEFWGLALAFELKDLRTFAEIPARDETNPLVKARLETFFQLSR